MHRATLLNVALVGWLWLASAGCAGEAQGIIEVVPPEPAPAPVTEPEQRPDRARDEDQDGIADDADLCVGEKEDGLAPKPADGCPSAPPAVDGGVV